MAQLAKVSVAAAPACPSCRNRLTGLPLDDLAAGAGYQCPFCGEHMNIPKKILDHLIRERDERLAAQRAQEGIMQKIGRFFSQVMKLFSK